MQQPYILVLFHSNYSNTAHMAEEVAHGVEQAAGMQALIRTVPPVTHTTVPLAPPVPESGPIYATMDDLQHCSGLALGSPTHFGNMTAAMKHFWDQTTSLWLSCDLIDRPAAFFTSTGSLHGGQESTNLSMMLPLLHHGMIIMGLPYSEPALMTTKSGGTPYGASHVAGPCGDLALTKEEIDLCRALGKRLASIGLKLIA